MGKSKNHRQTPPRHLAWQNERCQRCGKLIEYYGYRVELAFLRWELLCQKCGEQSIGPLQYWQRNWSIHWAPGNDGWHKQVPKRKQPWWRKMKYHW